MSQDSLLRSRGEKTVRERHWIVSKPGMRKDEKCASHTFLWSLKLQNSSSKRQLRVNFYLNGGAMSVNLLQILATHAWKIVMLHVQHK